MDFIIDDGVKEYTISNKKGKVISKFSFNPTDTGILHRYKEVLKHIKEYDETSNNIADDVATAENFMKSEMEYLFGEGIADTMFGVYQPMTLLENGDFFIEKVMDILSKIMETETNERFDKKVFRIKQLTEKKRK